MEAKAQIIYFHSRLDSELQPLGICSSDSGEEPKPLLVELEPGTINNPPGCLQWGEKIVEMAKGPCVWLRPCGRGPGTVFQGYGEVDVLEAIEVACRCYSIDRRRISLFGCSMGGAGTWYLGSHHPDLFAAIATFAGYCDYRLWKKPGGMTFPMQPWEEPSWKARSAAFLIDNFLHTAIWIIHGEWDRSVGGGVDVEQSRQMAKNLSDVGIPYRYTELPETGHDSMKPEVLSEVIPWLIAQRKPEWPLNIDLATFELRHNRNYWVTMDQFLFYGGIPAKVRANFVSPTDLQVETENVRVLSLGPLPNKDKMEIELGESVLHNVDLTEKRTFACDGLGSWKIIEALPIEQKHYQCSGPIGDIFQEKLIIVFGTHGTRAENFFLDRCWRNAQGFFQQWNGGVHRGGIPGTNWVNFQSVSDRDLDSKMIKENSLFCFGTYESNSILAQFNDRLPLAFGDDTLSLYDRVYHGERLAAIAIFPHPLNSSRYLLVHGGITEDAITWGSHLNLQLLPDFLVYDGDRIVDWGFADNNWKLAQPPKG